MSPNNEHPAETNSWYVVQCKPSKELRAAAALEANLHINVYVPEVRKHAREGACLVPLFPGYIFIRVNLDEVKFSSINSIPGVVRLLEFGCGPQRIPVDVIEVVRAIVDRLNAQGGVPSHRFQPGDEVRFTKGPFRDLEAQFIGPLTPSARVKVLLYFLGRLNEVQVDADCLELDQPHGTADQRGGRRTRGKGRVIKKGNPDPKAAL
jgi:transcriptional antiterminator RfaH